MVLGFKRPADPSAPTIPPPAPAAAPFPVGTVPKPRLSPEELQGFVDVSKQSGFHPAELLHAQIIAHLAATETKVYSYSSVKEWLTERRKEAKASEWCWRPLRTEDIVTEYVLGYKDGKKCDGFYAASETWACRPYQSLIPMSAMRIVVRLHERFRRHVIFFVSDHANPVTASFIMVRSRVACDKDCSVIFDAWGDPAKDFALPEGLTPPHPDISTVAC
jgi:hypothetical protein